MMITAPAHSAQGLFVASCTVLYASSSFLSISLPFGLGAKLPTFGSFVDNLQVADNHMIVLCSQMPLIWTET